MTQGLFFSAASTRLGIMNSLSNCSNCPQKMPSSSILPLQQGTPDFAGYKHVRGNREDNWKLQMEHRVDEMYHELKTTATNVAELLAILKSGGQSYHRTPEPETFQRRSPTNREFNQRPHSLGNITVGLCPLSIRFCRLRSDPSSLNLLSWFILCSCRHRSPPSAIW